MRREGDIENRLWKNTKGKRHMHADSLVPKQSEKSNKVKQNGGVS